MQVWRARLGLLLLAPASRPSPCPRSLGLLPRLPLGFVPFRLCVPPARVSAASLKSPHDVLGTVDVLLQVSWLSSLKGKY